MLDTSPILHQALALFPIHFYGGRNDARQWRRAIPREAFRVRVKPLHLHRAYTTQTKKE